MPVPLTSHYFFKQQPAQFPHPSQPKNNSKMCSKLFAEQPLSKAHNRVCKSPSVSYSLWVSQTCCLSLCCISFLLLWLFPICCTVSPAKELPKPLEQRWSVEQSTYEPRCWMQSWDSEQRPRLGVEGRKWGERVTSLRDGATGSGGSSGSGKGRGRLWG